MRDIVTSLTLGLVLILGGCIPSLHPLYTDKDLVFDTAILGEWVRADHSEQTLTFTKGDENEYKLVQTDEADRTVFIAHLVRLDGKLFLDVVSDSTTQCDCLCGVHMFFFISQVEPTLTSSLDSDWIEKFLKKNPSALKHEFVGKDLWLTAPPKKLQSFVLKHLNTKDAFTDPNDYVRKR